MNENINIKEGSITRRLFPIDKLKVNTTDNKDSMWVTTGKANTGVLHASENGIYIASEDGYKAYSEVIVRVTKDSFDGDTSNEDEWKDIDKPIDIKMNNPKIKDTKISGIDPVSGNPVRETYRNGR